MQSFITFIEESTEVKFRRNNPGGDWLKKHQQNAEITMKTSSKNTTTGNGLDGKITGYFTHTLELPTKHLKNIPGANGEHEYRDNFSSSKHTELSNSVAEHGFNSKKHAILIGVNHRGKPYILEGNHRLAHAIKHGHENIHADVRYFNGGEDVKGQGFHPDQVLHLHNHGEYKGVNS